MRQAADPPGFDLFRRLLAVFFKPLYRLRIEGRERLLSDGPLILAANHVSYWDAVFLQIACPRRIRWILDEGYYHLPVIRWVFRYVGCIPVSEAGGNRAALSAAIQILKDGGVLGIFPEGQLSRTGRMGRFRTGVAMLAARTGAAVVPVYLRGAFFAWHKGQALPHLSRVEVRIAEAMHLRRREEMGREGLQAFSDALMGSVKGMYGHGASA